MDGNGISDTMKGPLSGPASTGREQRVMIGAVDAAYLTMIEREYETTLVTAQQLRAVRLAVVWRAHQIADGSSVAIVPASDVGPMHLLVVPPTPPKDAPRDAPKDAPTVSAPVDDPAAVLALARG